MFSLWPFTALLWTTSIFQLLNAQNPSPTTIGPNTIANDATAVTVNVATITPPFVTQIPNVRSAEEAYALLSSQYSIAPIDATIIANEVYAYGLSEFLAVLSSTHPTTTSTQQATTPAETAGPLPLAPVDLPTTLTNCATQLTTIGASQTAIGLLAATEVNLAAAISSFCAPNNPITVSKAPSATYSPQPFTIKNVVPKYDANWYLINVGFDDTVQCPTAAGPLVIQSGDKIDPPGGGYIGPQLYQPDPGCVNGLTQVTDSCPGSMGASWEAGCWRWEIQAWTGRDAPPGKMRRRGLVGEVETEGI